MIPFESGVSEGPPRQDRRFTVSFYLTAMLFILFDIEIVFLYPLAIQLNALGWFGLVEFLVFIAILARRLRLHLAQGSARVALARKLPLISDRPLAKAGLNSERVLMPNKGPGVFEERGRGARGRARADDASRRRSPGRRPNSMWPDTFGLACCAIEMMSIVSSRYDIARFGMERVQLLAAPGRPADRLRAASAHKMAAPLRQVYDQMLEPKWVIAMGACASSGGMFNNYTILQGVDKIVPVDIHVPGCPPRPEALMEGIVRLHEKIRAGVPPAYEIRGRRAT